VNHEEPIYDVSCLVTVPAPDARSAVDKARKILGPEAMGQYTARLRYQGPLTLEQRKAVAKYLICESQAKGIMEDCAEEFPEEQFDGDFSKMRRSIEEFIGFLRDEHLGV